MLFPDLYNALRMHKVTVLLGTLACVLATFLITNAQPKYYEAAAVVRIQPTDEESNPNDQYEASQRLARTYAEVYTRGAVTQQIGTLLTGPAPGAQRPAPIDEKELVAQQVKDLDLLSVGALTTDPRRSAQIANVAWRALDRLSDRDRLTLVTPAVVPEAPASPNLRLNLALALFAGLILSVGLALILYGLRQPIPEAEGIERDFGVPVLTTVPRLHFPRAPGPGAQTDAAAGTAIEAVPTTSLGDGTGTASNGRASRPETADAPRAATRR